MNEMKNAMKYIHKRLDQSEDSICEIKDRSFEIIQSKEKNYKRKKKQVKKAMRIMKYQQAKQYSHYGGTRRSRQGEKGAESIFKKIMVENYPNLGRDMDIQVPQVHRSPSRFNSKRTSPRYIVIKLAKIKDNFESRNKNNIRSYQDNPIRLSVDFLTETLQSGENGMIYSNAERQNC